MIRRNTFKQIENIAPLKSNSLNHSAYEYKQILQPQCPNISPGLTFRQTQKEQSKVEELEYLNSKSILANTAISKQKSKPALSRKIYQYGITGNRRNNQFSKLQQKFQPTFQGEQFQGNHNKIQLQPKQSEEPTFPQPQMLSKDHFSRHLSPNSYSKYKKDKDILCQKSIPKIQKPNTSQYLNRSSLSLAANQKETHYSRKSPYIPEKRYLQQQNPHPQILSPLNLQKSPHHLQQNIQQLQPSPLRQKKNQYSRKKSPHQLNQSEISFQASNSNSILLEQGKQSRKDYGPQLQFPGANPFVFTLEGSPLKIRNGNSCRADNQEVRGMFVRRREALCEKSQGCSARRGCSFGIAKAQKLGSRLSGESLNKLQRIENLNKRINCQIQQIMRNFNKLNF